MTRFNPFNYRAASKDTIAETKQGTERSRSVTTDMLLKTIEDIFYENLAHNFSEYLYFDI
jgi:hypothetical protein